MKANSETVRAANIKVTADGLAGNEQRDLLPGQVSSSVGKLSGRRGFLAALLFLASCRSGESTTQTLDLGTDSLVGSSGNHGPETPSWRITSTSEIEGLLDGTLPGAVVEVPPGEYRGTLRIESSGTAERPITIRPRLPGSVTIDGSESPADSDLVTLAGDNVVFEGFNVRNARRSGISVWGAQGVAIRNNKVTKSQRAGIWVGHGQPGEVTRIALERNTIASNCLENRPRTQTKGWPRAISVDLATEVSIVDNEVSSNYGEGIGLLSTSDALIANNRLYDNFSVNIYLDNTRDIRVTGNTIWHSGNEEFFRFGRPAHGVMIANEYVDHPIGSENIRVQNNTFDGVGMPFYAHFEAGGGLKNGILEPNIVLSKP